MIVLICTSFLWLLGLSTILSVSVYVVSGGIDIDIYVYMYTSTKSKLLHLLIYRLNML